MNITKEQLKQIIKEEFEKVTEMDLFGKKKAADDAHNRAMKVRHLFLKKVYCPELLQKF